MSAVQGPPASRAEIFGWAMFDFANSSYTTVIVTVAFSVYFTRLVAPPGQGEALWGRGIALGNLIVLLLSPIIGAIADDSGRKKLFLFFTYATCVLGTALLYFVTPGQVGWALTLFVLSFIGIGISFYPYMVPPSITIWQAAAPDASLLFLLVGAVVLVPLILAYTAYAYWVFRGKIDPSHGYH